MNRRTFVSTAGCALSASAAGCLSGVTSPGRDRGGFDRGEEHATEETAPVERYAECHLVEIDYEWLPDPIRKEVDSALENGRYESERLRFAEAVDTPRSFLVVDHAVYDPAVERSDETQTLTLSETDAVRAPTKRVVRLENEDGRDHELRVVLTGDGKILEKTVDLEPDERTTLETTDEFGTYDLLVETTDGRTAEELFTVGDGYGTGYVAVAEDGLRIGQDMAEVGRCSWQEF